MTIENGTDRVAIHGSIDFTRDKAGLTQARAVKEVLDQIVQVLQDDPHLPDKLPPPGKPKMVRNPFV
ncbi:MAG: hypothetical protein JOZ58_02660 [Acetobacteraceae bacterium]|nr:hypothetical protein [Acetobacteraceae bacterium]